MDVEIIPYTPQYRADFERITREWFEEYHLPVEPFDERLFADPDQVLATGGAIFFARCCDEIVGTCGVMKHSDPEEFELIKLGVRRLYRGMHIGQRLVQAALEHTRRSASPQRIVLYTNTRLVVARFLYRKLGFIEQPMDRCPYKKADLFMCLSWEEHVLPLWPQAGQGGPRSWSFAGPGATRQPGLQLGHLATPTLVTHLVN